MEFPKKWDGSCPTCKQKMQITDKLSKSAAIPGYDRVLLLASYCDDCTDDFPCVECLQMCNVAIVPKNTINVLGDFGLMRDES